MSRFFKALALFAGLIACVSVRAGGPGYDEIADSLVNQSQSARPGAAIQITGNPWQIEHRGALVAQCGSIYRSIE